MSKYLLSAAAAAFMMVGGSAAWTQEFPPLPNSKWEWVVIGESEPSIVPGLLYVRNGVSGGCQVFNATENTPGATVFGAQNPGGNISDGKGTVEVGGGEPEVVPGDRLPGSLGNVSCPVGVPTDNNSSFFVAS